MSEDPNPDRVSPIEEFEDFDRHFEVPDAPLHDTRSELDDWKAPDIQPAMEHRDTVNPYPTTDGDQMESAENLL